MHSNSCSEGVCCVGAQDPEAKKPENWVDDKQIPDPDDVKPEDWDVPQSIVDPDATQPEDWDEEEDGEWEAPTIPNPDYKGEWKPKMIDNPDYKGEWEVCRPHLHSQNPHAHLMAILDETLVTM